MNGPLPEDRPARGRERLRRVVLAAIALLYVFSVPWYRSPDAPLRLWLGLPDWVATALGCYLAAAVLNAWAWWSSADDARDEGGHASSAAPARAPSARGERP